MKRQLFFNLNGCFAHSTKPVKCFFSRIFIRFKDQMTKREGERLVIQNSEKGLKASVKKRRRFI